ncbi:MAG: universal stress protein [Bacteroidales bacterium]|nr:universal stress protein [Bacteroidales bacterium]
MKKILIPTDFSEISKNAVKYGFHLAEKIEAEIHLVHVLEIYKFAAGTSEAELISTILPAENISEMEETAQKSFENFMALIMQQVPSSVPFKTKVVTGHLVNEMVVQSSMPDVDLLILAVSSSQDLITRFTHNTLSAILSEAQCPVMVVPSTYGYKPIQKVVFATDFQKEELDMLDRFLQIFGKYVPELNILHVSPKPIDFNTELKMAGMRQLVAEKIQYSKLDFTLTHHKNVVQKILEQTSNADLLLMLKEHEGFFKSLFEASKTEKITHFLKIPMLSYRIENFSK